MAPKPAVLGTRMVSEVWLEPVETTPAVFSTGCTIFETILTVRSVRPPGMPGPSQVRSSGAAWSRIRPGSVMSNSGDRDGGLAPRLRGDEEAGGRSVRAIAAQV